MTDTPPEPKRRRWRWLAIALLCLGAVGVVGVQLVSRQLYRRVGLIELGDSEADVVAILGAPDLKKSLPFSAETGKLFYGPAQGMWDRHVAFRLATTIYRGRKCPFWVGNENYPVEIRFDVDGRVVAVRVGESLREK